MDALVELYGGTIYAMVKQGAFKWTCFRKNEILSLVNNYFKVNPSRSGKKVRLDMVNKFYELRGQHAHNATPNSVLGKVWKNYAIKWNQVVGSPLKKNRLIRLIIDIEYFGFLGWQRDGPFSLNWKVFRFLF